MASQEKVPSVTTPALQDIQPVPVVGTQAPRSSQIPIPNPNGKPTVITFLRKCGCPFAEKTFLKFRFVANRHPEANFVAVSHSDQKTTDDWVIHIGGEWDVQVVADPERQLYSQWGLGLSKIWHLLNPWTLYSGYKLGKEEGIWGIPTEGGDKWQIAGTFAVDNDGIVQYAKVAKSADDIPDFEESMWWAGLKV